MKRVQYILGTLDDDDIDWLVAIGKRQEISPDAVLIQAGQPSTAIYLILEGQFAVLTDSAHPIAYLGSSEVVGEMSFIDTYPPSATVRALEASLVLAIPKTELASKLHHNVCFAARFYEAMAILLSIRLRSALQQLEHPQQSAPPPEGPNYTLDMADKWELGTVRYDWLLRRLRHEAFQTPA
jgi:CRP-like cAMP-binding protein